MKEHKSVNQLWNFLPSNWSQPDPG
jgi:hypothetical protein